MPRGVGATRRLPIRVACLRLQSKTPYLGCPDFQVNSFQKNTTSRGDPYNISPAQQTDLKDPNPERPNDGRRVCLIIARDVRT